MSTANNQYDRPTLSLEIATSGDGAYEWQAKLSAADHTDTTKIGYLVAGTLATLNDQPGKFEIRNHDRNHPKWTPMPLSHRPDLREAIEALLSGAIACLKAAKHH
jgi:hypothetical protein